ncbi:MAG: tyrosine-type recombinase/integrase [Ginsengibacter sp.]
MEKVILKPIQHRGEECIGIYFEKNAVIQNLIQSAGAKWSRTQKCWYVSLSKMDYEEIAKVLHGKVETVIENPTQYLSEKNKNRVSGTEEDKSNLTPNTKDLLQTNSGNKTHITLEHSLSRKNIEALQNFKQILILKSYSPSTIKTYTSEFLQFLNTIKEKEASTFTSSRIKDYLQYCHITLGLAESTLHSRMNALKFYYEQVLHQEKFFWDIPRPKKPDQLPKVLSENEIGRMFNAVSNLKHKAILFTAYSAGLRVSEVVNLKIKDVDSDRMQLLIEKSKGKKDRYVGLSILLLDVLRAYLKNAMPRPVKYVFENPQRPGESYSIRSAQQIFHNAKEKARINKNLGIHSLRHSFATHLLEKGIDIRYIKDLLGHFSIKTTERYLHVKKESLINIPNVLDELNKSINLEW